MIKAIKNEILFQESIRETRFIQISQEEINLMLHWYKPEFFQIQEANYGSDVLLATVKFSEYPFIKGKMPFISANLINLAIDQCALIHIGMMVKYNYIKLIFVKNDGSIGEMTFDEYNQIVGDEFVTAKIEGRYLKPIPPTEKIQVISSFLSLRKNESGRYLFEFLFQSEHFFIIKAIFVYPLTLKLVGR